MINFAEQWLIGTPLYCTTLLCVGVRLSTEGETHVRDCNYCRREEYVGEIGTINGNPEYLAQNAQCPPRCGLNSAQQPAMEVDYKIASLERLTYT